uniref:Cystatin-A isoform X2 n=1 Tax=Geotrypetes seraphini TaxID=260995 RepID=A0A6P8RC60_GEOSA|nr:cystatin-A isoform X2 [Geotrypetes seraphini]
MLCGGTGAVQPATPKIQDLIDQIKSEFEAKVGTCTTKFEAIEYKQQVVAGINYFIKVLIDNGCIHLKIFVPLPYENKKPSLTSYQTDKARHDEICYF